MIENELIGDRMVIRLRGRVDIASNEMLASEFENLVKANPGSHFTIDLSNVEYISSSGLGALVRLKRELAINSKELSLFGLASSVAKVFEVSGMKEHFHIFETEKEALAYP